MIIRNLRWGVLVWVLGGMGAGTHAVAQDPPFWGTVWVDPDIIRPSDWTAYQTLSYAGIATRQVFDRRDNFWSDKQVHIFDATYADALEIEVQVNSVDFSNSVAAAYAASYAEMVGRLPTSLRLDVETMTIHGGGALPFGGGSKNILVHVDVDAGTVDFLEEVLFHEAAHVTYSLAHDTAPAWQAAQSADPNFISLYGRDHPNREDVPESLLMWYAVRYRSDRLDAATIAATNASIPHRLAYFDALPFQISAPDFNFDGHVDSADYVVWRNMGGSLAEYEAWRANFGESGGSGSSARANAAVPEPTTLMLLMCVWVGSCLRRGRNT